MYLLVDCNFSTVWLHEYYVQPPENAAIVVTASSDGRAVSQSQNTLPTRVPDAPNTAQEPHLSRISEDSTRNEKQSFNIQPVSI